MVSKTSLGNAGEHLAMAECLQTDLQIYLAHPKGDGGQRKTGMMTIRLDGKKRRGNHGYGYRRKFKGLLGNWDALN